MLDGLMGDGVEQMHGGDHIDNLWFKAYYCCFHFKNNSPEICSQNHSLSSIKTPGEWAEGPRTADSKNVPVSKKEDPGKYRAVDTGKIPEQIMKLSICKYIDNKAVIGRSQHGFVNEEALQGKWFLSLFYQVTHLGLWECCGCHFSSFYQSICPNCLWYFG